MVVTGGGVVFELLLIRILHFLFTSGRNDVSKAGTSSDLLLFLLLQSHLLFMLVLKIRLRMPLLKFRVALRVYYYQLLFR